MDREYIKYILANTDHTLLRPETTTSEIDNLISEGERFGVCSICIPPCHVAYAKSKVSSIKICTVVGFPLGYSTSDTKVFEGKRAIYDGADEIDMVINIGWLKEGCISKVLDEIKLVKRAIGERVLKVIIETCLLTKEEIAEATRIVSLAGADYVKTSTGFSKAGAEIKDIHTFLENMPKPIKIKAAGGISTLESAKAFLDMGFDRIGASNLIRDAKKYLGD